MFDNRLSHHVVRVALAGAAIATAGLAGLWADPATPARVKNLLLVHGAFADGSPAILWSNRATMSQGKNMTGSESP
jgi:hypothetical protein